MNAPANMRQAGRSRCVAVLLGTTLIALGFSGTVQAQTAPPRDPVTVPATAQTAPAADSMEGMDMTPKPDAATGEQPMAMKMDPMQGGRAPADARDTNAFADGYEYTGMPGFDKTDQIVFSKMLIDELEFVSGNEGEGVAWSGQFARGNDRDKLWLRSEGQKISGQRLDPETTVEALWWHAYSPFWGRTVGIRRDLGPGARTWAALGVEGLAPYWFDVQLTGYVGDDGRVAARLKASYDMLLTNRLILTPQLESNVYSKTAADRRLGSGVSNVELGLRLRYEVARKFAPYVGFVWERAFSGTAEFQRAEGEPVTERRFVAGVRLWW